MFDLTWIGIPITIAGVLFVVAFNKWRLPDRRAAIEQFGDTREYTTEMIVEPGGPLVGKTIDDAGLRSLPNTFLAEIEREGDIILVAPEALLRANDRLVFAGVVEGGGRPAEDPRAQARNRPDLGSTRRRTPRAGRGVVSPRCPLIGQTVRDGSVPLGLQRGHHRDRAQRQAPPEEDRRHRA